MSIVFVVVGFLLVIVLIVAHEFGHFWVARRNGVVAEEFGIFFPPRLFKKRIRSKKGDFDFSINLLPLGGFVKLKGEHDSDTKPGTFGAASVWAKTKIMAAGVVINLAIALVLLTVVAWVGMPKLLQNQFTIKSDTKVVKSEVMADYVEPHSPASRAGLAATDRIIAIGPIGHVTTLQQSSQLLGLTQKYAGEEVKLVYARGNQTITKEVRLRSNQQIKGTNEGHLGVSVVPQTFTLRRSTWSAPIVAVGFSAQITKDTFVALGHAFGGLFGYIGSSVSGNHAASSQDLNQARSQFASPVGLYVILKSTSVLGYQYLLEIIALISLTLAVINFLPIPAVDGRVWILLISRLFKKPLSAKKEELVNGIGMAVILALGILLIISDIFKFF